MNLIIGNLFILLSFLINSSLAHRNLLLFAPGYGGSHVIFHTRIADAIAKAGYNVISFEPEAHVDPAKFEGPKLAERILLPSKTNSTNHLEAEREEDYQDEIAKMFEKDSFYSTYMMGRSWQNTMLPICEQIISSPEVIERLRAYKFDAIIYEPFLLCATGLGYLLGIKTQIFITSLPLFESATELMGLPFPASHVPSMMPADYSDQEMGYFQRFWNIIGVETVKRLMNEKTPVYQKMFQKHYGLDFPDLNALAHEASFCFVEADEFLEFPRPFQFNVIPLGPFGLEEYENGVDLPPPFNSIKTQMALISLGTHTQTSTMPKKFLENLLRAMAEHPNLHFVMKVDKEDVENMNILAKSFGVENVFFAGWIPQTKLLAHPNLHLFISHSGFNSLMESSFYGVPMIGIPFFSDQLRNAKLAQRNGWGIRVKRQHLLLDHSPLANAINEILTNPIYKRNAERTKRLIRNKPMRAEQRLKANLDLLFLHGEGHLSEWKSAARLMGPITYYNLDIFIPVFLVAQFGLFLFTKLLIAIYKKLIPKK